MATSHSAKVTLPADDQILIERDFDAPRELVFRAMTEPGLVAQWWTAKRGKAAECEIDLRVGGKWRYVMVTDEGGFEVAFHGEYLEIVENERIVSTEVFEGAPVPDPEAAATVNTMTLADKGDGTTGYSTLIQCKDREIRDAIIESGMEGGLQDALDLLEGVANELR